MFKLEDFKNYLNFKYQKQVEEQSKLRDELQEDGDNEENQDEKDKQEQPREEEKKSMAFDTRLLEFDDYAYGDIN